jgi:hypothetical protein
MAPAWHRTVPWYAAVAVLMLQASQFDDSGRRPQAIL